MFDLSAVFREGVDVDDAVRPPVLLVRRREQVSDDGVRLNAVDEDGHRDQAVLLHDPISQKCSVVNTYRVCMNTLLTCVFIVFYRIIIVIINQAIVNKFIHALVQVQHCTKPLITVTLYSTMAYYSAQHALKHVFEVLRQII